MVRGNRRGLSRLLGHSALRTDSSSLGRAGGLAPAISDMLPIYGSGPGHEEASVLFETVDQGITAFSLFEKSPSGNAILIGSTGSGKSTLACGLILGMTAGVSKTAPSSFVIDVATASVARFFILVDHRSIFRQKTERE